MIYLFLFFVAAVCLGYLFGDDTRRMTQARKGTLLSRSQQGATKVEKEKEAFEQWLSNSSAASQRFQNWYKDLDDDAQRAFVTALKQYFERFDSKVEWLTDESLRQSAPSAVESLEQSVSAFYNTYRNTNEARAALMIADLYKQWVARPFNRVNLPITEKLHARLVASGAIEYAVPLRGTVRAKRRAMLKAIKSYGEENAPALFEEFEKIVTNAEEENRQPTIVALDDAESSDNNAESLDDNVEQELQSAEFQPSRRNQGQEVPEL